MWKSCTTPRILKTQIMDNRRLEPKCHFLIGRDSVQNPESRALIYQAPRFGGRLSTSQLFNSFLWHKAKLVTLALSGHPVELWSGYSSEGEWFYGVQSESAKGDFLTPCITFSEWWPCPLVNQAKSVSLLLLPQRKPKKIVKKSEKSVGTWKDNCVFPQPHFDIQLF